MGWRGASRWLFCLAIGIASPDLAHGQAFNPMAQLWPTGIESSRSALTAFGSAVQCARAGCDLSPSFGLEAHLFGPFRVAVAGPRSALQYGLSYAQSHIDVATRIGGGVSVVRPFVAPSLAPEVRTYRDSLGFQRAETLLVSSDTAARDATRWSSAEARLTWRESRWWVTAVAGRMAVAQEGVGLWGGLQFGTDIGRGTSLLFGATTSSRLLLIGDQTTGRSSVSLGFGFNTAIFSGDPSARAQPSVAPAFVVSASAPGRVRITIRVRNADSVEFASDCTRWTSVAMERRGDVWAVDVPATAGLHHANIRVNGGAWVAPPGLAAIDDDFAGEVGIFVVQ